VTSEAATRRSRDGYRRKARVYRRCFIAMTLTSLVAVSGVFVSNMSDFRPSPSSSSMDADRDLNWAGSVNDSEVTQHINDRRETAWCLYGEAGPGGVNVTSVEWIGRYGGEASITWSKSECGIQDLPNLVGTMHNHPNRFDPELSLADAHSFGASDLSRIKAIAVLNEDEVVIKGFDQGSLRGGFDTVSLRKETGS